jgi:xylitol oxidase
MSQHGQPSQRGERNQRGKRDQQGQIANWAGNVTFRAGCVRHPESVAAVQELVAGRRRVHALGTGHSFSRVADTTGDLISVASLPVVMDLSTGAGPPAVLVSAGVRYAELAGYLHQAGYALRNLGSLPHISVAGSCATGTHGSGDGNQGLAAAVSAMELVTAQGDLVRVSREADGDRFAGLVVGLGALGIVTSLTLDLVPDFAVRQYVYDDLPFRQLTENLPEIFASGYSVSVFTRWRDAAAAQVWLKLLASGRESAPPDPRWLGARLADGPRHPIEGIGPQACTEQLGAAGPWHQRLPHFRPDFTPSAGAELQSEYLVPRQHAGAALAAINGIRHLVAPLLQVCELRTVAADDLWLSPAYQRDSLAIHFTWVREAGPVRQVLTVVEQQLAPLAARPHWGKLSCASPAVLAGLYDRAADFGRLRASYDSEGKFGNDLIDGCFPPPAG